MHTVPYSIYLTLYHTPSAVASGAPYFSQIGTSLLGQALGAEMRPGGWRARNDHMNSAAHTEPGTLALHSWTALVVQTEPWREDHTRTAHHEPGHGSTPRALQATALAYAAACGRTATWDQHKPEEQTSSSWGSWPAPSLEARGDTAEPSNAAWRAA